MRIEHSELITKSHIEYNNLLASSSAGEMSPDKFIFECLHDNAEALWPSWSAWTAQQTNRILKNRGRYDIKVKRHIQKRYAAAFRALDAALSAAEFMNHALLADCLPPDPESSKILGASYMGGIPLRNLLLIGMQARAIIVATEIAALLKVGLTEGASARCRTLHEISIKSLVIISDKSPNGTDLAERYYVSGVREKKKEVALSEDEEDLLAKAEHKWGAVFAKGDNNWALPAMSEAHGSKNVSFKDLEELVGGELLRHIYLDGNAATHAGSLPLISDFDFKRPSPFQTRSEVEIYKTGRIGQTCAFYLSMAIYEIAFFLATSMEEWDTLLKGIDFYKQAEIANKHFREVYKRYVPRHGEDQQA
jgi:hypothetical protein